MDNLKIASELTKLAKELVAGDAWVYKWDNASKTMTVVVEQSFSLLSRSAETKEQFLDRFNTVVKKIDDYVEKMVNKKLPDGALHIESNGFVLVGDDRIFVEIAVEFGDNIDEEEAENITNKIFYRS